MEVYSYKTMISVTMIWIFSIVAVLGFLMGFESGFMVLLPMNILIWLMFIIWNVKPRQLWLLLIPYAVGFGLRLVSLRYEWIMGSYQYGETLGYKIYGVPITSGFAWIVFAYSAAAIAKHFMKHMISVLLCATFLSWVLHMIFTFSSSTLDILIFSNGVVSVHYGVVMLFVLLGVQSLILNVFKSFHTEVSVHIFLSSLVFGVSFLFVR